MCNQRLIVFCIFAVVLIKPVLSMSNEIAPFHLYSNRTAKFFGIGLVRFENAWCIGRDQLEGTCYTRRQCRDLEGVASGRCASNIGVCCVVQKTCGGVSAYNNTYFVNPNFPSPDTNDITCTFTIPKCNPDICQIRVDFLTFTLAQPDADGICVFDSLVVLGGGGNVPVICGDNSGQHIYVDFLGERDIHITVTTSGMAGFQRNWKFKVAQIGCDCPTLAPRGCLQYHVATSGVVSSFNYGQTAGVINTETGLQGTRQLANTNYGICVAMEPGYCSITWQPVVGDIYAFTVTGDTSSEAAAGNLGVDPDIGFRGEECETDFIVIPNPCENNAQIAFDRFCGNYLPPLTTGTKPFVLSTITDGNEEFDVGNRGFSIQYTQHRCSGQTQQIQNRECVW